jgi:carbamoyl-phosphate synthase large subunit
MLTVLITSAGRRNQLIGCFRRSAETLSLKLRVLAADLRPELSSACAQADAGFKVPRCTAPDYIPALLRLCETEKVDLLVPTIDPELTVLSRAREEFAAIGTRVVVSAPEVTMLAQDKFGTAELLKRAGVSTPKTLWLRDYLAEPERLANPVIAKPNAGSASVGIVRPKCFSDLEDLPAERYIVQEMWQGAEYTVNVFFDGEGRLRCAVPHLRIEVRAGEVAKGRTERHPDLIAAAHRLAAALPGAWGPLCFQAILRPDGGFCVFEINARFGGGYPLAHEAGACFAQWLLEEVTGRSCSANDQWVSGLTMLRYDAAVFVGASTAEHSN